MYKAFLLLAVILIFSGCVDEPQVVDDENDTLPVVEKPPVVPEPDIVPVEPEPEIEKLTPGYTCNNEYIHERLSALFEEEIFIGKLVALGAGRGIFTCNIVINNLPVIQIELRPQQSLFEATTFYTEQERLYFRQYNDFIKTEESITENSLSFYSPGIGETRILFLDADPEKPVIVKVKTLADYRFEKEKLFEVARELERII